MNKRLGNEEPGQVKASCHRGGWLSARSATLEPKKLLRRNVSPAASSLVNAAIASSLRAMLPKKRAVCINYGIVQERDKQHPANMESTFPTIFFAAIIGVIVFIAVSHVLLDSHE